MLKTNSILIGRVEQKLLYVFSFFVQDLYIAASNSQSSQKHYHTLLGIILEIPSEIVNYLTNILSFSKIFRHKIEFKLTQLKDHRMETVEATCRGDPGAVFLSSTVRSAVFATQGKNMITKVMSWQRHAPIKKSQFTSC